ncbi:MAG: response regulator transcription factor [Kiritimatiellae bacterium]|nr:response regulator transcription factor [Kiritimatiellia bacterium]
MDKIVLIEDDPGIRTVIRLALKGAGFTSICEAGNGTDGLALVQREKPSLVILDLMLPGMDGLAVCSAIRQTPSVSGTPIVMLTARTAEEDVVRGLELGADDYITKPFSNAILVARVKAALRRTAPPTGPVRKLGLLVLDETTRTASVDGVMLSLTRSEFDLLDILSAHPCRVYTRQQIIARIQREEKDVTDRTVDTLMVGLRRKLGEWAGHVETIRGIGYRITP